MVRAGDSGFSVAVRLCYNKSFIRHSRESSGYLALDFSADCDPHMSHSVHSLKGFKVYIRHHIGYYYRVIKGDTRSSDYSSCVKPQTPNLDSKPEALFSRASVLTLQPETLLREPPIFTYPLES